MGLIPQKILRGWETTTPPVFLPGNPWWKEISQAACSPWGCKECDVALATKPPLPHSIIHKYIYWALTIGLNRWIKKTNKYEYTVMVIQAAHKNRWEIEPTILHECSLIQGLSGRQSYLVNPTPFPFPSSHTSMWWRGWKTNYLFSFLCNHMLPYDPVLVNETRAEIYLRIFWEGMLFRIKGINMAIPTVPGSSHFSTSLV